MADVRIPQELQNREPIIACTFYPDILTGMRSVAKDFTAETGINVSVQSVPYELYEMWLQSRFLAGQPPEVMISENTELFWHYGQNEQIINFDELVSQQNPFDTKNRKWRDLFYPSAIMKLLDPAGKLYILPFTQYGTGFFYNKEIYQKANVDTPKTWTQMIANFSKIKESGLPPHADTFKNDYITTIWVADRILECFFRRYIPQINLLPADPNWQFDPYDPFSVSKEKIDLSERIVAFEKGIIDPAKSPEYRETAKMLFEYAMTWNDNFMAQQGDEMYYMFAKGNAASIYNGTWYFHVLENFQNLLGEVASEKVFDYGIFLFPQITQQCSRFVTAGGIDQNSAVRSFIVVPVQKQQWRQQAGLLFAKYITAPVNAQKLFDDSKAYDLPAVIDTSPRKESAPLQVSKDFASLSVTELQGFDKQSLNETIVLSQQFFMEKIDLDEYLQKLSIIHRNSLIRLSEVYKNQIDIDFIRTQIGRDFK